MNVRAKVIDGTVRWFDADGNELTVQQVQAAVADEPATVNETNRRELLDKARTALTANAAFLADSSVTTAEAIAQVKALTRQVNALIRITTQALDSDAGV